MAASDVRVTNEVALQPTSFINFADIAANWTANLTALAVDVANFSLNLLDIAVTTTTRTTSIGDVGHASHSNTTDTFAFIPNATSNLYTPADDFPHPLGTGNTGGSDFTEIDDGSRLEHAPQLSRSAMVKVYVLSVMALLSLFGNILTMWNIYKTRISRRSSRHNWSAIYSLIFHLSIADLLVTGFCIIGEAAWCYTVQWLAGDWACKLVKLFQMFSLYLSTYVLVLIGIDRWIAVKYPMKSLNMAKRCYRLLGGIYVLSFLLSMPQFFIFRVARGPFIEEFHQCVTHGFYTAAWQEQLYATFTLVFTFLLPLTILFITYMSTFRTISSSEKMFESSKMATYSSKPSTQTNRQRLIHKAKMKSLRISVVIIIAFLVCWTPYNVMMIIFMFWNPDKRFGEDLQAAIFFFGMSNSLVNPLIYGAFHLCPMKRKASKNSGNNNALNRGDSQRQSMLTAVTQIDSNGRQIRTYHRQPSYYRTHSNSSNNCKEHVGLLQVTPTPSFIRKTPSGHHAFGGGGRSFVDHSAAVAVATTTSRGAMANGTSGGVGVGAIGGSGSSATSAAVVLNYDDHRVGLVATATVRSMNSSSDSINGISSTPGISDVAVGVTATCSAKASAPHGNALSTSYGFPHLIGSSENVSSV